MDIQWPMLKDWKEKGLVRYIGVSMVPRRNRFDAYEALEKFMTNENPDIIMTGYSMTQPWPGDRITPLAKDKGIAVIAAEADEVALVVGRGLDGIAAEWANVVYRGGLDF